MYQKPKIFHKCGQGEILPREKIVLNHSREVSEYILSSIDFWGGSSMKIKYLKKIFKHFVGPSTHIFNEKHIYLMRNMLENI